MTTCKDSAVHSSQTGNGNPQTEKSGETARGQTAIAPCIPRPCSARTRCREHSPHRMSLRPPGTDWGQFHYAAVQDRIGHSPRTYRREKTCDRSYPRSDELAGLPKLLVMPDRSTSKAGAVSSRLRVSVKSGNLNACNTGWTSTIALNFAEPLSSIMTIRRTLYPGFQDALCPVQPPASLEWLGIFDSEGFPGRKSVRLVRPRILPSNYRRVAAI